jgi:xylulokinase
VDPRLFLDYHVIPGKYLINGCMAASGSIIKWFRTHLAPDSDYRALDAEGSSIPCGSEGLILLPYFLGEKTPINDPLARGVLFGLTLSHTRGHIYRAILEGISYGFQHHLAVLAERNLGAQKARVTNGGARSALWKQVTADVLGIPLEEVANHPGSSLGAAFVAGMGTGQFKEWEEIERFIRVSSVVRPDPNSHGRYRAFTIYRGLYDSLKEKFCSHQAIRGKHETLGEKDGSGHRRGVGYRAGCRLSHKAGARGGIGHQPGMAEQVSKEVDAGGGEAMALADVTQKRGAERLRGS